MGSTLAIECDRRVVDCASSRKHGCLVAVEGFRWSRTRQSISALPTDETVRSVRGSRVEG